MKKLLSIILVGILAVSSFILTTFAAENEKSETEIEREKLGWLLDAFKILNTNIGEARIYNYVAGIHIMLHTIFIIRTNLQQPRNIKI